MKKAFIGILVVLTILIMFVGVEAKAPDVPVATNQVASVSISGVEAMPNRVDIVPAADESTPSTTIVIVLVTIFLSVLIESLVEYFVAPVFNNFPKLEKFKWMQMYIAFGIAIASTFIYQLDLVSLLSKYLAKISAIDFSFPVTILGLILTGAAIGRGSNYLHDLVMKWFTKSTLTESINPTIEG
jgi:hypothetical protein